jgi:hypothetical protein
LIVAGLREGARYFDLNDLVQKTGMCCLNLETLRRWLRGPLFAVGDRYAKFILPLRNTIEDSFLGKGHYAPGVDIDVDILARYSLLTSAPWPKGKVLGVSGTKKINEAFNMMVRREVKEIRRKEREEGLPVLHDKGLFWRAVLRPLARLKKREDLLERPLEELLKFEEKGKTKRTYGGRRGPMKV